MNQRDLVLVPFPFSDQSGQKVRPALILSNNHFNQDSDDRLVCAITTVIKPTRYSIVITQEDIEQGMLYERSMIKIESVFKIHKTLVLKRIATVRKSTFSKAAHLLMELVTPSNS